MQKTRIQLLATTVAAFAGFATQASAAWNTVALPNLVSSSPSWGANSLTHDSQGRFLWGNNGSLWIQNSFGQAGYTQYSGLTNVDPAFVVVLPSGTGIVGSGAGYAASFTAPSPFYSFDATNTGTPNQTSRGSIQNYSGAVRDASSFYIGGTNGTGGKHAISYVSTATWSAKTIIDNVSTYSAGFTSNAEGDLFVLSADNNQLRKFTAAQVNGAISGTALQYSEGQLLHTFSGSDGVAMDSQGRFYVVGWQFTGIEAWDSNTNAGVTLTPSGASGTYRVSTFSNGGTEYVGYAHFGAWAGGTPVTYGWEQATLLTVPEPAVWAPALGVAALAGAVVLRRRTTRKAD